MTNKNIDNYINSSLSNNKKINLEVGFGSGENLNHMIRTNKDSYFIGCEPYLNGLASFLLDLEKINIERVKVFKQDVRELITCFPKNFLSNIIIFFPDPWPKNKHKKRRIVNEKNIELMTACLKKEGKIYTATDVEDYFNWMIKVFNNSKKLKIIYRNKFCIKKDFFSITRYEKKALDKNKKTFFLEVKKYLD